MDFSAHETITNIGSSDKYVRVLIAVYDSEKSLQVQALRILRFLHTAV